MSPTRWVGPGRLALTLAAAGGLVAAATLNPMSGAGAGRQADGEATTLAPVTSASLTCPGPELSGIDGVDDIDVPAAVGAAVAPQDVIDPVRPTGRGALVLRSGSSASDPVTTRGATTTEPARGGRSTDVAASGAMAPGLAATQEWAVDRDEVRGLATVPCSGPGSDLWLLAGGGAAGRQERLVLTNPGANEVAVDIQALGLKGPLQSPTGSTVVPARGRVSLLVDAVTGGEESPAVRVRANGGTVRAVMSDIWLDGSTPAGAETTLPTAAPSTRQVIPAALVSGSGSIRIAVPGDQQAVVSARVIGKDGAAPLPGGGVARVPARSSGELEFSELPQNLYAVELTSDVPVVASLFASWREDDRPGDFVWAPSTTAATGLLGAAFPDPDTDADDGADSDERADADEGDRAAAPHRRLLSVVSTAGPSTVAVTWQTNGRWTTRNMDLAQDTSAAIDLGDAQSVWVRRTAGKGAVRAAVGTLMTGESGTQVSVAPLAESTVSSAVSRTYPVP